MRNIEKNIASGQKIINRHIRADLTAGEMRELRDRFYQTAKQGGAK